jgi:hypothetical protein
MSKRITLKFKKMLKKAEFVHADLEYHEELFGDAQMEFNEAFLDTIAEMPGLKKREWDRHVKKIKDEQAKELLEEALKQKDQAENNEAVDVENAVGAANKETMITEEHPEGFYLNPDELTDESAGDKSSVVKKLYRKVAAKTHPDKLLAAGLDDDETEHKERIFIKAKTAYENDNWYTLYSLALDLGIKPGDIEQKHIDWIEEDIRFTMGRISKIGQLFIWIWYTSSESQKVNIMSRYFKQVYDWDISAS